MKDSQLKEHYLMSKIGGSIPLLYGTFLLILLITLGYFQQNNWKGIIWWINWGIILFYLFWMFAETNITFGELAKGSSKKDGGTYQAYALGRAACILSAIGFGARWPIPELLIAVGIVMFIGGISLRLYAIKILGEFYSHRVRIVDNHQVISQAPYSVVRHPAYTGMFLAHCGILVLFFNWYCLVALLGLLLPAMIKRIKVEEYHLYQLPGYLEYAEYRNRLIPFIW